MAWASIRVVFNSFRFYVGLTMKLVYETEIAGFPIRLYKGKNDFAVQYGKQFNCTLTYSEAADELGRSVMHALACDGELTFDIN